MTEYPMRSPEEWAEEILKPENVADDHGVVNIVQAIMRETYEDAAKAISGCCAECDTAANVIRGHAKEFLGG